MILATYLPLFRIHELEIFDRNYREIKPDEVAICIDYYYTERQMPIVEMYTSRYSPHLILGNWRNRTSCLLRLVDYIQRRGGDGLIVDRRLHTQLPPARQGPRPPLLPHRRGALGRPPRPVRKERPARGLLLEGKSPLGENHAGIRRPKTSH